MMAISMEDFDKAAGSEMLKDAATYFGTEVSRIVNARSAWIITPEN
ncbi:hypothetical protein P3T22_004297 [Paraburkholderia sp. GAS348]